MESKPKNILQSGAESGMIMGALFVIVFALMVSTVTTLTSMLFIFAFVSVPFVLHRMMRRTFERAHGMMSFAGLWLSGIVTMCCASVILAAATFAYFKWLQPDFWTVQLANIQQIADTSGDAAIQNLADQARTVLDSGLVRPIDMAMMMGWSAASSGSLIALAITPLARRKSKK